MLAVISITVYVVVVRLLSRVLPESLDGLIMWIENDLENKFYMLPKLPFKELEDLQLRISEIMERHNRSREEAIVGNKIKQIAHDIRSPLEVLKGLEQDFLSLPESPRRRIQMCINRIEEISFNLLKRNKESSVDECGDRPEELLSLLESIILEKKIEYSRSSISISHEFDCNSYGLFSKLRRGTLKRVISNLINNGIEAINEKSGTIKLKLYSENEWNIIEVADTGAGIDEKVREKLFIRGFTTKVSGNGLGLSGAKEEVSSLGGEIDFESRPGEGTIFRISLPKTDVSPDFMKSIDVYKYKKIIILDDDPAFHEIWKDKFEASKDKIESYYSIKEIFSKYNEFPAESLLLSDL